MTHTTNLNLNKPGLNDNVNVATDINDNMDIIDSAYGALNSNNAKYIDGTAKVVDAISITRDVVFAAKIDCSNIVPNTKVKRILGCWIGINPAGNTMMAAQTVGSNYVEVYMKSSNTQTVSANTDVRVDLIYED